MLSFIAGLFLAISINYTPPVDYEMSLAGNFGEPRPNHFHNGIDVKTGGVEGKPIYSIGEGYVSRITVGMFGFGNAVYVAHPDGKTSVYCHLKSFSPRIKSLLRKWQYENQSYIADVRLSPLDCPLSEGQFIAVSGNTGASQAPHLHLELRDTKTGRLLDPLSVLSSYIKDETPPMAHGFLVYPMKDLGLFNKNRTCQAFRFISHNMEGHFTGWGKIGFGLWANDYSEATYNKYGVYETILLVDGKEVFHACVTDFPSQSTRMVNVWGDYGHYYQSGVWYMKSFTTPSNRLDMLKADDSLGIVDINEERDYHLEYILRDIFGNTSNYKFVVSGIAQTISKEDDDGDSTLMLKWDKTNCYSLPGMQLVIPYGTLADDIYLRPEVRQKEGKNSPMYSFSSTSYPLLQWAELSIAVNGKVKDPSKLFIVGHDDKYRYYGGEYRNGWVTGQIRDLGLLYELDYDDEAPEITPVRQEQWSKLAVVELEVDDNKSGIKTYKGYVDGRFVLFEKVEKCSMVVCDLSDTPIEKTGNVHQLKFFATDHRENTRVFNTKIVY